MFIQKKSRQIFPVLLIALLLTGCNLGAAPAPTLDINAINTVVVRTTIAQLSGQFTQTALAAPTITPMPTDTPAASPTIEQLAGTTDASTLPTFAPLSTTDPNVLPTVSLDVISTPLPGSTQIVASPAVPAATAALGDACSNLEFEGDITIPDGTVLDPGVNFQKIWKIRNTGTCAWDEGFSLVYVGGSKPDLDPYTYNFKNTGDFVKSGEAINIAINLTTPCTPGDYSGTWRMRNDKGYYFGTYLSVYVTVTGKCK